MPLVSLKVHFLIKSISQRLIRPNFRCEFPLALCNQPPPSFSQSQLSTSFLYFFFLLLLQKQDTAHLSAEAESQEEGSDAGAAERAEEKDSDPKSKVQQDEGKEQKHECRWLMHLPRVCTVLGLSPSPPTLRV